MGVKLLAGVLAGVLLTPGSRLAVLAGTGVGTGVRTSVGSSLGAGTTVGARVAVVPCVGAGSEVGLEHAARDIVSIRMIMVAGMRVFSIECGPVSAIPAYQCYCWLASPAGIAQDQRWDSFR